MKPYQFVFLIFSLLLFSFHPNNNLQNHDNKGRWVNLFNGKNLDNWIPKIASYKAGENFGNTFRVENGILSTRYDKYGKFNSRFGALFYNKQFSNFRLKVEYRFVGDTVAGAPAWGFRDGGIQYYCQSPQTVAIDQPFPLCLEYNLLGGNGKDERASGEICANGMYVEIDGKKNNSYCTPPTVKRTLNGDQWVTAEIDVKEGKITQYINGEEVVSFSNPHYDTANPLSKPFIKDGNTLVKDGYISLQSNSNPMDFRKIEIMEY